MKASHSGIGTAHGKIILMGEHAVVYGLPAIALPFFETQLTVTITAGDNDHSEVASTLFSGQLRKAPTELHNLIVLKKEIESDYQLPKQTLKLVIQSEIPPERGMGSSAAVATAFVRAFFDFHQLTLTRDSLNYYVERSELMIHGNPSGLDAAIVQQNQALLFQKEHGFKPLTIDLPGYLIVADTGQTGQTRQAVQDVARYKRANHQQFKQDLHCYYELYLEAKNAFSERQVKRLGQILTNNHRLLKKWHVSNDTLDTFVETSLAAGALGAKLTGGGLGGCMIALADSATKAAEISNQLKANGAINTWIHTLERKTDGR